MSIAEQDTRNLANWSMDRLTRLARPLLGKTILDRAALTLFVLFVIAIAIIGVKKPEYNWDMAPYIAAAIKTDTISNEELHRKTWGMIEARASESQVYKLQAGNPYNLYQYQNPDAFVSMLPMYEVKIAYIATIRALTNLMDAVDAPVWISVISALIFGALVLWWMQQGGFLQGAPVVISIMLLSGYFYMARIATPDLLFAVFCLGGIYLMLRGRENLALPLLFTAFMIRPDNIIFLFALLLAAIAFNSKKTGAFALFAASLATYFWITGGNDHPGWWTHFYFSNVEIQNTMVGFKPDFSLTAYLKGLMRGISVSLQNNNWPKLMLVLIFAWALLARAGKLPDKKASAMLATIVLTFGGKFIVFPLPDDRTYFVYIVAFTLILLETWKPRLDLDDRPSIPA